MSIYDRYNNLLKRRASLEDRSFQNFSESYEKEKGDFTRYILGAMKPVEAKYTKRLIEQGNRVESQLSDRLEDEYSNLKFRRQGSVSNNTHIKYYSDVDVLVIIDKFHTLAHPLIPSNPYKGDPEEDLLSLRKDCKREISNAFPAVNIDDSGSTAISIEGGSLACKVDIVPSNWYDTVAYSLSGNEYERGIQVLDKHNMVRKLNFPFMFNYRLIAFDYNCQGIPIALIRLLKTIKADAIEEGKEIELSSFDICSIIYRMPTEYLYLDLLNPLAVIDKLCDWCLKIISNDELKKSLMVIDETRKIFDNIDKEIGLLNIFSELIEIKKNALSENTINFRTASHVVYS